MTDAISRLDLTSLPFNFRHPARLRTPDEYQATLVITVHVTDVEGGFGVAPYQIASAKRMIDRGKIPLHLLALSDSDIALALRLANEPYHYLASRRLGACRLHSPGLRTSHGNAGNIGPGWAIDCGRREALTPQHRDIGVLSLLMCIDDSVQTWRDVLPVERVVIVPHRAWAADRAPDPGAIVWQEIVRPVAHTPRPDGIPIVIGYDTRASDGRPIPRSWDPDALYDDRGRRL